MRGCDAVIKRGGSVRPRAEPCVVGTYLRLFIQLLTPERVRRGEFNVCGCDRGGGG